MKKTIKLTESELSNLIKRVVKENIDNRPDEFYSHINELINYEYSDMDGKTAFITRGAEIAFSRGKRLR